MKLFMYTTAFLGMVAAPMVQAAGGEPEQASASKPSSRVGGSPLAGTSMEELLAEIERRKAAEAEEGAGEEGKGWTSAAESVEAIAARKAIAELNERAAMVNSRAQEEYDATIAALDASEDSEEKTRLIEAAAVKLATEQSKADALRAESKRIAIAQAESEGAAAGGGAEDEGEGEGSAASASSAAEAESDEALVARLTEMLAGVEELERRSVSAQGEAAAEEERYRIERKGFFSSSPDTPETAAIKRDAEEKRSKAQRLEREARRFRNQVQAEAKRIEKMVSKEWRRLEGQAKAEAAKLPEGERTGSIVTDLLKRALTGSDAKAVEERAREYGKHVEKEVRKGAKALEKALGFKF